MTSDPNFNARQFLTLNISEMTRDRAIVTIEIMGARLNGIILDDLE